MTIPSIVFVASGQRAELRPILTWLRRHGRVRCLRDLPSDGPPPDVVILAYTHPACCFCPVKMAELQEQWPRAQWLAILGDWCDRQLFRGNTSLEIPVISARDWWQRIALCHTGVSARMMRFDEAIGMTETPRLVPIDGSRLVAIHAQTEYARALSDALGVFGVRSVHMTSGTRVSGVDLVVWAPPTRMADWEEAISKLRSAHGEVSVVALTTFSRSHEVEYLRQRGVACLSQPFRIDDLVQLVAQCRELRAVWAA